MIAMDEFLGYFGVDRAIAYSLLGRFWQLCCGLISVIVVIRFLDPMEQGYLYTFNSVLMFQIMFELGLPLVLTQFAAHEMAFLRREESGAVTGDPIAKSRLASVVHISIRWYMISSLLMLLLLGPGGYYFFQYAGNGSSQVQWQTPWIILAVLSSASIFFTPLLGILEGTGLVKEVAVFRLLQDVTSYTVYWCCLVGGLRLFAVPVLFFMRLGCLLVYLLWKNIGFYKDLLQTRIIASVSFAREVWPFQWKFMLCAIASLISYSMLTPFVFAHQGARQAGRLGLMLSIAGAMGSFSAVWINTKVPQFCNFVAKKDYAGLNGLFAVTAKRSLVLLLALNGGIMVGIMCLGAVLPNVAARLTDPLSSAILLGSSIASFPNIAASAYLRAHKTEVTTTANLSVSIFTAVICYIGSSMGGLVMISTLYLAANMVLSFWIILLYNKYRLIWHNQEYKHGMKISDVN